MLGRKPATCGIFEWGVVRREQSGLRCRAHSQPDTNSGVGSKAIDGWALAV